MGGGGGRGSLGTGCVGGWFTMVGGRGGQKGVKTKMRPILISDPGIPQGFP